MLTIFFYLMLTSSCTVLYHSLHACVGLLLLRDLTTTSMIYTYTAPLTQRTLNPRVKKWELNSFKKGYEKEMIVLKAVYFFFNVPF